MLQDVQQLIKSTHNSNSPFRDFVQICGSSGAWADCVIGLSDRNVTGTTDTIATTDRGNMVTYSGTSAVAVTLPAASTFGNNFFFRVEATGSGLPTFTPASGTINGVSSLTIGQGNSCTIYSPDNANYVADCNPGTVTWGNGLTATQSAHGVTVAASNIGPTFLTVASDQSVAGTTLANATNLSFSASANASYSMTCHLIAATTGNFVISVIGPASPAELHYGYELNNNADTKAAFGSSITLGSNGSPANLPSFTLGLVNGANSGTVQIQFASGNASNTVTLYAGTYCEVNP